MKNTKTQRKRQMNIAKIAKCAEKPSNTSPTMQTKRQETVEHITQISAIRQTAVEHLATNAPRNRRAHHAKCENLTKRMSTTQKMKNGIAKRPSSTTQNMQKSANQLLNTSQTMNIHTETADRIAKIPKNNKRHRAQCHGTHSQGPAPRRSRRDRLVCSGSGRECLRNWICLCFLCCSVSFTLHPSKIVLNGGFSFVCCLQAVLAGIRRERERGHVSAVSFTFGMSPLSCITWSYSSAG